MKRTCLLLLSGLFSLSSAAQTPDEYYLKGASDIEQDRYINAVENLTLAITAGSSSEKALLKRGEAYYHLSDLDHAILDFSAANDLHTGVANLWLARCHARKGEYNPAMHYLEEHLVSDFRIPEEQIKKDPAFDELQLTDEWFNLWQNEWYPPEEDMLREANYYADRGRFDDALNKLEAGIAKGLIGPDILFVRGKINLEQGNFAAAISDFTSAINLNRNNSDYFKCRGYANLKAGRYKDAVNDLTRVLRDEPEYFNGYLERAEAYAGIKSYNLAIEDVATYLKYFENDQSAIFSCGDYCFQQGDYLNALQYFNMNLQADPNSAIFLKSRGKTYLMTRTYQYAIYDLTMSLDLDPSDGETYLYLGITRMETGDREAACSDFEKARRLGETRALKYIIDNCQ